MSEHTERADGLEPALRAFAPTLRPPRLTDDAADVTYLMHDTAVGRLLLATGVDGALLVSAYAASDAEVDTLLDRLARRVSPRVLRGGAGSRPLDVVRRQLDQYLAGHRRTFELDVDLALATPFQREVLAGLTAVGYGQRTSYGALAGSLGRPRASRAVGAALGANPVCVVLPCHRVVAASGALTGYAGGLPAKRLLLALETPSTGRDAKHCG